MLDIIKYLRGYLRIRVSGFSPERFMNLCSNKDILLWDIVQEGDSYCMCISLQSVYKLKSIARKTRTKVVILERCGLPFLVPVMRRRKIFFAGFLLAIGFWYLSGQFVWDIDIEGNSRITKDQLETFLQAQNVREGMRKDHLDIESLEKEIRRNFSLVTWTSAKLDGTRLRISIKENDAPILNADIADKETEGTDLVSEFAGTVVSMVVRKGVPQVRIGTVVEEKDVLVDGKVPVYNEDGTAREYLFTDADADIVIEHTTLYQDELPFDYIAKEYTGRETTQPFVRLGEGFEGKLPGDNSYLNYDRVMRQGRPVLFEKLRIPVYIGTYTYREYQNVEHEYTQEAAEGILKENLMQFLTSLEEKGVQIIEKDVTIDTSGSMWVLHGEFLVQEPAGKRAATVKEETAVEESQDGG